MKEDFKPIQPNNPSDKERRKLLKYSLNRVSRIGDFENVIHEMSPPEDILNISPEMNFKDVNVGIIGGGLSGMAAAFELRKRGFNVTILEAEEERIGGRVYTHYFDKEKTLYGELGAMRVPISHECTWKYINQFKLDTRPFVNSNENSMIYVRSTRIKNDSRGENIKKYIYPHFNMTNSEKELSFSELIEVAFSIPMLYIDPIERKESVEIKRRYSEDILKWFSLSQVQILKALNFSLGAINCIGSVESHFGALYNCSTSELLQDEYTMNLSFAYEIEGGTVKLPYAFYESLNKKYPEEYENIPRHKIGKCLWKRGARVKEIIHHSEENKIELKYKDESSKFDYVICSVPFGCLRNIKMSKEVSSEKLTAIREVNYVSSFKAIFLCRRRFWEEGRIFDPIVGGVSNTDLVISTIWYPSDNANKMDIDENAYEKCLYAGSIFDKWKAKEAKKSGEKGVLLASYAHTGDAQRIGNLPDEEKFELIKRQVEEVHGLPKGYMDDMVEDYKFMYWNDNQNSLGGFCHYYTEQKVDLSYASKKSEYNGRLYFAGEHICQSHGWIQSAIQSGLIACSDLVNHAILKEKISRN